MHVTPLWQKLKQLGLLDKQVITLQETQAELLAKLQAKQKSIPQQEVQLETISSAHKKITFEVGQKEVEVSTILQKIEAKEKLLEQAANAKQQGAIEHEISTLKKQCSDLEDQCLKALTTLERLAVEVNKKAPAIQEQLTQDKKDIVELEKELEVAKKATTLWEEEQKTVISSIEPEWFAKYQQMKTHVDDPIAPIISDSCGSCFYKILFQDLSRLKKNAILPCHGCFRLLYYDQEEKLP